MKTLVLTSLIMSAISVSYSQVSFAEDIQNGSKIFKARCATCHEKGKNLVNTKKQLTKSDLKKNEMFDRDNIVQQVTYGKGSMPRFEKVLKPKEIEDVAAYVLSQAETGWK